MDYFVGLDVGLRSLALCIVDSDGNIVFERALGCDADEVTQCLERFDGSIRRVGFEAGTMSQHLFHSLTANGFDVVCMEARHVAAALSAMRNKTDKNDARGIAQLVRSGWFRTVHIKGRDSHYTRALLTCRKAVLKKCMDLELEVRGLLKVFGIRLPAPLGHHRFDSVVRPIIEADEGLAHVFLPLLEARNTLLDTYHELDKRVKEKARRDPVCELLMSTPGVGAVTALHFKAAVEDPTRFKSSRTVGAHFGLTPRRFQSGEVDNPGRISRAGDADVRACLYSAANSLLTRTKGTSDLKSWGMRLMRKRGRKRATVAVARKLAIILHRMWADNTEFRWNEPEVAV